LYYDIVPGQRLVYSYEMYADGVRFSVSLATIEFVETDDGTTLTWTEQGAYLDGVDGPDAPRRRQGGTGQMLAGPPRSLAYQIPGHAGGDTSTAPPRSNRAQAGRRRHHRRPRRRRFIPSRRLHQMQSATSCKRSGGAATMRSHPS